MAVMAVVSRGIALCELPWDHIVQIALWDRIVRSYRADRIPVSAALYGT